MDNNKRLEIKALIEADIDNPNISREIEEGYIFGKYGRNEHYMLSEINAIRTEILTPVVIEIEE